MSINNSNCGIAYGNINLFRLSSIVGMYIGTYYTFIISYIHTNNIIIYIYTHNEPFVTGTIAVAVAAKTTRKLSVRTPSFSDRKSIARAESYTYARGCVVAKAAAARTHAHKSTWTRKSGGWEKKKSAANGQPHRFFFLCYPFAPHRRSFELNIRVKKRETKLSARFSFSFFRARLLYALFSHDQSNTHTHTYTYTHTPAPNDNP